MSQENFIIAKHYFSGMDKKDLKLIGFKNPNHYRLIYRQKKELIQKYPKGKTKRNKPNNKNKKEKRNANKTFGDQIEGFVEDTGLN